MTPSRPAMSLAWWRRRWWLIAAFAAALAITGGVIALTRPTLSREDQDAIRRFEQVSMRSVRRAVDVHGRLGVVLEDGRPGGAALAGLLIRSRRDLERARRERTTGSTRPIVKPALARFLSGIGFTLRGVGTLEHSIQRRSPRIGAADLQAFTEAWSSAQRHFAEGMNLFEDLRCRARLPACP